MRQLGYTGQPDGGELEHRPPHLQRHRPFWAGVGGGGSALNGSTAGAGGNGGAGFIELEVDY
jgi:hypothetical protein